MLPEQTIVQQSSAASSPPVRTSRWRLDRKRVVLLGFVGILFLGWTILPAIRAVMLVENNAGRTTPDSRTTGLSVQEVHFYASDGVRLAGWLVIASAQAPTVILVHGFKGTRSEMLPWARFLYAAGYNVLLYDSRGCGESEGWAITLGAREPNDVQGAVRYLQERADLSVKRFGALGISLGAGIVLLAAAHEPGLLATVADSAWTDESAQIDRMDAIGKLPLLPYEPALVDALIGAHLADAQPLAVIGKIAPRAVMLIHSRDDRNATTPLAGEQQLYNAAGEPKEQWIAPSGGHTGALKAHPDDYQQRVLTFFAHYLR